MFSKLLNYELVLFKNILDFIYIYYNWFYERLLLKKIINFVFIETKKKTILYTTSETQ